MNPPLEKTFTPSHRPESAGDKTFTTSRHPENGSDDTFTARTALELQLGRNILAAATHHLGEPERAKDYFKQSLLEDPDRSQDEPVTPTP